MKFALLLLLLPFTAFASELYPVRNLSEKEIVQMYQHVLLDACQHADEVWHERPAIPGAGYWGGGGSGEDGTRANGGMVLASGALLKYSNSLTPAERQELMRKALASLRYG